MAWVKTLLRRGRTTAAVGLTGTARIDRDPRVLAARLRPGDVAVIDAVDLDRAAASDLVSAGVAAVVNVSSTISGRYPSLGATVLVDAGVELVDGVGPDVVSRLRDGQQVTVADGEVRRGDTVLATGTRQTPESVGAALAASETGLSTQMEAFAASAAEYLRREHRLLLEPSTIPSLRVDATGRDVLVVAAGPDHREDLARLRRYAKEFKPVVVAVDEAADTARELGYRPAVIVGDLANVSDEAIRAADDVVVRIDADGATAGLARVDRMGITRTTVTTTAHPADLALLMADEAGARVIVSAGTDRTLVSMLDSGRTRAAADFVTRLRVGSRLVDAQAAAAMYRPRVSAWLVAVLVLVAVLALGAAAWLTPTGQDVMTDLGERLPSFFSDTLDSLRGTSPEEPTS
jgi:uncharacterized membrane-anchored protein